MNKPDDKNSNAKNLQNVQDLVYRSQNPNPIAIIIIFIFVYIITKKVYSMYYNVNITGLWLHLEKKINVDGTETYIPHNYLFNHCKFSNSLSVIDEANNIFLQNAVIDNNKLIYYTNKNGDTIFGVLIYDKIKWVNGDVWIRQKM
jgi:hypothetical protein